MCSIWLVVLISGNRYWAVCRPHSTGRVWTNQRTGAYVVFVVFLVMAFNAPRLFEYHFKDSCIELNRTLLTNYSVDLNSDDVSKERWSRFTTLSSMMTSSRINAAEPVIGWSNAPVYVAGHVLNISINVNSSHCSGLIRPVEFKTDFGDAYSYRVVYKVS